MQKIKNIEKFSNSNYLYGALEKNLTIIGWSISSKLHNEFNYIFIFLIALQDVVQNVG